MVMDNVGVSVGLRVEVGLLDSRSDVEGEGEGGGEGDSVVDGDTDHDAVTEVEVEGVVLELSVPTGLPDALALELEEGEQE